MAVRKLRNPLNSRPDVVNGAITEHMPRKKLPDLPSYAHLCNLFDSALSAQRIVIYQFRYLGFHLRKRSTI